MQKARPQVGWYHGWNIVTMCVLIQMAALGLTLNSLSLFIPAWSQEFKAPVSTIALSITLFSLGTAASSYLIGIVSGHYPARWIFLFGLGGLGLAHLAISLVNHLWQVMAIYALVLPFVIGSCGTIPAQSLVSRWFVHRVGLALGLSAFGLAIGGVILPPLLVHMLPAMGWRTIWAGYGAIILLVILPLMLLTIRDRPAPNDPFGYVTEKRRGTASKALAIGEIIRRRNYWVIMGAFLASQLIGLTVSVTITPIVLSYGGTAAAVAVFLPVYSAVAIVGKVASGWAADKLGNRIPLTLVAIISGAGIVLLAFPSTGIVHLVLVGVTAGLSGATWPLLASSMLAEFGEASFGRAFGLACAISPIGTFAPPIIAKIAEVGGGYSMPLAVLGLLSIVSGVAVLVLFRAQPFGSIQTPPAAT